MRIPESTAYLDQILRQTRVHHVQLSAMADVKANMLLTVASVVVTLAFPHLDDPRFTWTLGVLIGFSLVTIVLAVYTVMPRTSVSHRKVTPEELHAPGFNLLFFGDFTRMEQADWQAAMEAELSDPRSAYDVALREIYTLGRFLARRKYRLLGWAYRAFLAGFLAGGAAYFATRQGWLA